MRQQKNLRIISSLFRLTAVFLLLIPLLWIYTSLILAQNMPYSVRQNNISPTKEYKLKFNSYHSMAYKYRYGISISPTAPTIMDTIQIKASGEWPDSCVPEFESYQVSNNEIRLDFTRSVAIELCAQVISGWEHTIEVSPMPGGIYTATACINNITCVSKKMVVFEEVRTLFFPLVAK